MIYGPADNSIQPKTGSCCPRFLYSACPGLITWVERELQLSFPTLNRQPQAANAKWERQQWDTPRGKMEKPRDAPQSSTPHHHVNIYGRCAGSAYSWQGTQSEENPRWHIQMAHNTESHSGIPLRWKSPRARIPGVQRNWCPLLVHLPLVLQPCTCHLSYLWLSCLLCKMEIIVAALP